MSETTPDTAPSGAEADDLRAALDADPELAEQARLVVQHLRSTPIDPVGDPGEVAP